MRTALFACVLPQSFVYSAIHPADHGIQRLRLDVSNDHLACETCIAHNLCQSWQQRKNSTRHPAQWNHNRWRCVENDTEPLFESVIAAKSGMQHVS